MDKEKVIVGIRRKYDVEAEKSEFFIEVYAFDERKTPSNLLETVKKDDIDEAYYHAEYGFDEKYDVEIIKHLIDDDDILEALSPIEMKPNFEHFRYEIKDFEEIFRKWLRFEKGWDLSFSFSFDGPDDYGSLGDIYMHLGDVPEELFEEIHHYYDQDIDYLLPYLQEMYNSLEVEYDYNIESGELYIFVPKK